MHYERLFTIVWSVAHVKVVASSSKFNLIIRYCIENEIYDLYEVNSLLKKNGYQDSIIQ